MAALLAFGTGARGAGAAEAAGVAASGPPGPGAAPSAAALVVRGIRNYQERAMRRGTEELERASAMRPGWKPAGMALATALLRNGAFERARALFEAVVGEGTARDLAAGRRVAKGLPGSLDPEALIGLAASLEGAGRVREADRLYRTAADVWGPASRESARAYHLLSLMLEGQRVPWGDAEAERAKAGALDPRVGERSALPPFPDPAADPELEPYTWPVAHARADSAHPAPATPPALAEWTAGRSEGPPPFEGTIRVEALVAEDGSVTEAEVASPQGLAQAVREAAVGAVTAARFELPAAGTAAPAWVSIDLPGHALPPVVDPAEQVPQQ